MLLQYEVTNAPPSVQLPTVQAISSFLHHNSPHSNVTFCYGQALVFSITIFIFSNEAAPIGRCASQRTWRSCGRRSAPCSWGKATNSLSQAYCMFPSNDPSPPPDIAVGITGTVPWPLYRLLERTNSAKVFMKLQEFGCRRWCSWLC